MSKKLYKNLGLDLVRVTEAAAVAAGRWIGLGKRDEADQAAKEAMFQALDTVNIDGRIVIGEEKKLGQRSSLDSGQKVGTGNGPAVDVIVDPIDGRNILASGQNGAISVVSVAPRNTMWSPFPAVYMEKVVVDSQVAPALVEECLHAPAAWTLALVGRVKKKPISNLSVFVLDRPRHQNLIEEIRQAGARVVLSADGDIGGALEAAMPTSNIDILMGVGAVLDGLLAACAIKSLRGAMLGYLSPQSKEEQQTIEAAGLFKNRRILDCDKLINDNEIFFVATGITNGPLLSGVHYEGQLAKTNSLILRSETSTQRLIQATHLIDYL